MVLKFKIIFKGEFKSDSFNVIFSILTFRYLSHGIKMIQINLEPLKKSKI